MKPLDLVELARQAASRREVTVAAGEDLFREGDEGDQMYVVADGTIRLTINGELLDEESRGGVVGELALIENAPRSATATACEDSILIPLGLPEFTALVRRQPGFAIHLMRIQGQRLRKAHEYLNWF
ncbi:MAG: cyclic nucleotide-binding domain-containing protein [Xanthomonadales bacterium]|nr:cyclic nucleotide-binding domain-containing protein [Xanthomonadales bacterium]NNL94232.1 cyclic nucleotide-binding domain-containing protein [Xanthomonadales bacterium]